jgi:hypothetical protein
MSDFDALIDTLRPARKTKWRSLRSLYSLMLAAMTVIVAGVGLMVLDALALPIRNDYLAMIKTPTVAAKQLVPLILLLLAGPLTMLLMRPEAEVGRWIYAVALVLAVFPALAMLTLSSLPSGAWLTTIKGQSLMQCLVTVPSLSAALLAGQLITMRRGAVTQPVAAGMLAGLTAGAIAAIIYAMICADDSPGFYGVWYAVGIMIPGVIGAILGRFTLRW